MSEMDELRAQVCRDVTEAFGMEPLAEAWAAAGLWPPTPDPDGYRLTG